MGGTSNSDIFGHEGGRGSKNHQKIRTSFMDAPLSYICRAYSILQRTDDIEDTSYLELRNIGKKCTQFFSGPGRTQWLVIIHNTSPCKYNISENFRGEERNFPG